MKKSQLVRFFIARPPKTPKTPKNELTRMVALRPKEQCFALREGVYQQVIVLRVNKASARVKYIDTTTECTVPLTNMWKKKKKKKKTFCKPDKYTPRLPIERFNYARRISVQPVCFGNGFMSGDFNNMLSNDDIRQKILCIFNDNTHQWASHGAQPNTPQDGGGGNACARPWQHIEDSIGMPTGPYFSNLVETKYISFAGEPAALHSIKEIIDEATNRIVNLLVKHPEKETICYSVDSVDSRKIGLAIFRNMTGDDVVDYISDKITDIPRRVRLARFVQKW